LLKFLKISKNEIEEQIWYGAEFYSHLCIHVATWFLYQLPELFQAEKICTGAVREVEKWRKKRE